MTVPLRLELTEGNKSLIDLKINVSRSPLVAKLQKFTKGLAPCTPWRRKILLRNSIFNVKTVGAQSAYNNLWTMKRDFCTMCVLFLF